MSGVKMSVIYKWPLDLYMDEEIGVQSVRNRYLLGAAGAFAAYWWGGGLPFQGQDMMTTVQAYLVGGLVVYAGAMATAPPS